MITHKRQNLTTDSSVMPLQKADILPKCIWEQLEHKLVQLSMAPLCDSRSILYDSRRKIIELAEDHWPAVTNPRITEWPMPESVIQLFPHALEHIPMVFHDDYLTNVTS